MRSIRRRIYVIIGVIATILVAGCSYRYWAYTTALAFVEAHRGTYSPYLLPFAGPRYLSFNAVPQETRRRDIDDAVIYGLARHAARMPDLDRINIIRCPAVTTASVVDLLKRCPQLRELDITGTGVDGALFVNWPSSSSLQMLALSETQLKMPDLLKIPAKAKLRKIYVRDLGLTSEEVQTLRETFPSIRFLSNGDSG